MSTPRPSIDELIDRGRAEVESKLPGAAARLYGTPESILAEVTAGHAHGLYGRVERAERQIFPQLMDDRWLDEALKTRGVSDGAGGFGRIAAVAATGKAVFTGAAPAIVPTGTTLQIGDEVYTIDAGYTYVQPANEDHEFDITAAIPGANGNAGAGAVISLASPIALVTTDGTVSAGGIGKGADLETIDAARTRLIEVIRASGAGGAPGDYVVFAKAASALVTRAWELPRANGQGTVLVLIADDNETPPVPVGVTVTAVQDALQATDVDGKITGTAPTAAIVTVAAVTAKALAVTATITIETGAVWQDSNGDGVKRDVSNEIAALIERIAEPGATVTTAELSGAIQRAAGVQSHTLVAPAADVTHTAQEIPYEGLHSFSQS